MVCDGIRGWLHACLGLSCCLLLLRICSCCASYCYLHARFKLLVVIFMLVSRFFPPHTCLACNVCRHIYALLLTLMAMCTPCLCCYSPCMCSAHASCSNQYALLARLNAFYTPALCSVLPFPCSTRDPLGCVYARSIPNLLVSILRI